MKVHRIVLCIVDHDEVGGEEAGQIIQNQKYPNYCIYPMVQSVETVDIGEWSDDHPLNKSATSRAEFDRLFPRADVAAGMVADGRLP